MKTVRKGNGHRTVVFFCMPEAGHFQALRAVIARIAARGLSPYVFTHRAFRRQVEEHGGTFVDLFQKYPVAQADSTSRPIPCRFVSFAGHFAEQVTEDVRAVQPALVVYDTFSVIGPLVARTLGIPYVGVCACHNVNPARFLAALQTDARVAVSEQCHRAVEKLRTRFGWPDASPFSYVSSLSPFLNVYCEPPQFLNDGERLAFEPVAFFGCLPDPPQTGGMAPKSIGRFSAERPRTLRLYASFGTVVWRYFAHEAAAALRAISSACAEMTEVRAVISLGGARMPPGLLPPLENPNVKVVPFINQARLLQEMDLFVTHHGLNSTHEAIFHRVPMISYPFFSDQPALASRCQEMGLAVPLIDSLRGVVSVGDVRAAIARLQDNWHVLQRNLASAADWERETMNARESVVDRIAGLIQPCRRTRAKAA